MAKEWLCRLGQWCISNLRVIANLPQRLRSPFLSLWHLKSTPDPRYQRDLLGPIGASARFGLRNGGELFYPYGISAANALSPPFSIPPLSGLFQKWHRSGRRQRPQLVSLSYWTWLSIIIIVNGVNMWSQYVLFLYRLYTVTICRLSLTESFFLL